MPTDVWELFDPAIAPHDGDLNAYLNRALQTCTPLFQASGASIFLRDPDGLYRLKAQYAIDPPIPPDAEIIPGEGVAGACLELLRPMLVKNVKAEAALVGRGIVPREELGTSMVIPLTVPSRPTLGVLNMSRRSGEPDFQEDDLHRAAGLAHQIALAVGSACILAESRQAHQWLTGIIESFPAAVLAMRPDGAPEVVNEKGRALLEERPIWLDPAMPLGRSKIIDPFTGQTWRVDCRPAGEGKVLIAEDITAQERESEESSRLRRLAEIGQMSAAVAHEIRNPLTGIRGAAQMVVSCPEQAGEFAQIIENEVTKLNGLCEDFLDFARPLGINRKPVRLSELLEAAVRLERPAFEAANVKLILECQPETPTILIDASRVEQVVRNLLRNALQACAPGDSTTLRAREDAFEVEDTGTGMTKEALAKLYVPFFTTKPQGTGLGLSTVRKIVDAHGGALSVGSESGVGTVVKVDLRCLA